MTKKKPAKTKREEWQEFLDQMQVNIDRTRALAEKAQAELDAKREREQQAS